MTDDWTPDGARRDAIIAMFTSWLDGVLEDESPPDGAAAELLSVIEGKPLDAAPEACGEYEIWSALTALTQDVKLQGRAFRDLTEAISPLQESLAALAAREAEDHSASLQAAIAALEASQAGLERRIEAAATDAAWREILDLLLDLRDRLFRGCDGLQSVLNHLRESCGERRWSHWFSGRRDAMEEALKPLDAIEQGNALILESLDESLALIGIHEIPAEDRPFDSSAMRAVQVEVRDDLPEGTVSVVHRRGYTWRGTTCRLAEVTVTRRPKSTSNGDPIDEQ